jgi:hypothetical protein
MARGRRHEAPVERAAIRRRVAPRECDALGLRHREGLVDDRVHHDARVGIARQVAVGQTEERTERVERGVVEHLGPELGDQRVGRFGRDPGVA